MWPTWALPCLIMGATLCAMELVATLVHRHVMHRAGWAWHKSHHEAHKNVFEKNDLYAVVFAAISIALFVAGGFIPALWWIGLGMVAYGLLYALLHDVLVHRRIPFPRQPRSGYLKRLVQAHRLHHAVHEREGAVSFGFLYAPPVAKLVSELRANAKPR
ncbi:MAG TPA: sterol desaturase family protein [Sphingomicrobium sp.]|nr:sterol desaturase family protein [Sphingomicrobium sp.]